MISVLTNMDEFQDNPLSKMYWAPTTLGPPRDDIASSMQSAQLDKFPALDNFEVPSHMHSTQVTAPPGSENSQHLHHLYNFNTFLRNQVGATESFMDQQGLAIDNVDSLRIENEMLQYRLQAYRFKIAMHNVKVPRPLQQIFQQGPQMDHAVHYNNPQSHHLNKFSRYLSQSGTNPANASHSPSGFGPQPANAFPGGHYNDQNFALGLHIVDNLLATKGKQVATQKIQPTKRISRIAKNTSAPQRQKRQRVPRPAYSPLTSQSDARILTDTETGVPSAVTSREANNPGITMAQPDSSAMCPSPENPSKGPGLGLLPDAQEGFGEAAGDGAANDDVNLDSNVNNHANHTNKDAVAMTAPWGTEHMYPKGLFSISQRAGESDSPMNTAHAAQQIAGSGQGDKMYSAPQGSSMDKEAIVNEQLGAAGVFNDVDNPDGDSSLLDPAFRYPNNGYANGDQILAQFPNDAFQGTKPFCTNDPTQQGVEANVLFYLTQNQSPSFDSTIPQSFASVSTRPMDLADMINANI